MDPKSKIPGDRLVLGMLSVLRTLVIELSRTGALDRDHFVMIVQQTAAAHREAGDPNSLADAIHAISMHIAAAPDRGNE
jgi:hypothetical protein